MGEVDFELTIVSPGPILWTKPGASSSSNRSYRGLSHRRYSNLLHLIELREVMDEWLAGTVALQSQFYPHRAAVVG